MSAYGDVAAALRVLDKEGVELQDAEDQAELIQMNEDLSAEVNDYLHRTLSSEGTVDDPVIWTTDAPLGPVLPVEDFSQLVQVLAYGTDVTADCVKRKIDRRWAAYQLLIYAPGGIPTGWIGSHASALDAVTIKVVAGWTAVPGIIVQAQTQALCRLWRKRLNMYADGGGSDGYSASPRPLLDADYRTAIADYVRSQVVAIGGP